jgi:hypothetical protein
LVSNHWLRRCRYPELLRFGWTNCNPWARSNGLYRLLATSASNTEVVNVCKSMTAIAKRHSLVSNCRYLVNHNFYICQYIFTDDRRWRLAYFLEYPVDATNSSRIDFFCLFSASRYLGFICINSSRLVL